MLKSSDKDLSKTEGRLRLRSNHGKSTSTSLNSAENALTNKVSEIDDLTLASPDDSLADFKSPKSKSNISEKNSLEKSPIRNTNFKGDSLTKRKKDFRGYKNDDPRQSSSRYKKSVEKNQRSIESLFARQRDEPSAFHCPVCWKQIYDANNCKIHMKNCAMKNKISNDKLIQAMELQEKQAQERKAIGLPAGPLKSSSIKQTIGDAKSRKLSCDDPDMELAMALSISLNEAKNIEHDSEKYPIALAIDSDDKVIVDINSTSRKSTLQSFGFYTNKPMNDNIVDNKSTKKRKIVTPTILQNRTQETRDQILAEKIAQILVGSEPITQYELQEDNLVSTKKLEIDTCRYFQNKALNKYYNSSARLWNFSQSSSKKSCYYVQDLHKSIETLANKENVDNSKEITANNDQIGDQNEEDHIVVMNNENDCDSKVTKMIENRQDQGSDCNFQICNESDDVGSLITDWHKIIANHYMSDVGIFTKNNGFIHAHNLVLWARCHQLTKDYQICNYKSENCNHKCEPVRYKIDWSQIDYTVAITFLSYVYCAKVPSMSRNDKSLSNQLHFLAEKYHMNSLLKHLNNLERTQGTNSTELHSEINGKIIIDKNASQLSIADFDGKSQSKQAQYIEENHASKEISLNTSPDLFDDTEILDHNDFESADQNTSSSCPLHTTSISPEASQMSQTQQNMNGNNISLFINKIQRQHARNILDSDTDGDTPLKNIKIYKRNPFGVGSDQSTNSHFSKKISNSSVDDETALSIFERAISNDMENKNNQQYKVMECQNSVDDDTDLLDESLYTKYMKTVSHNSISLYRKALGYGNNECTQIIESSDNLNNFSDSDEKSTSNVNSSLSQNYHNINDSICNDEIALKNSHHNYPMSTTSLIHYSKQNSHDDLLSKEELENKLTSITISSSDEDEPRITINSCDTKDAASQNLTGKLFEFLEANKGDLDQCVEHEEYLTPKQPPINLQNVSCYEISYDVTPRMDYKRMTTSDLHQQLNAYGLKPQKRCRAIQLLQYIYDELHPLVPLDLLAFEATFSNDSYNDNKNFELVKSSTAVEERELISSQESLDIRTIFKRLVTSDIKLHTKILMYEPLPLQLLYKRLKNKGFRGKIADVINFLDNECITFQDQEQKRNK